MIDPEVAATWISAAQVYATLAVAATGDVLPYDSMERINTPCPSKDAVKRYELMHGAAMHCLKVAGVDVTS